MTNLKKLASVETERHCLKAFFKHPEIFADVDGHISERDFVNDTNRVIFSVIRTILCKGEHLDKVVVAQKIRNLGLLSKEDMDIFAYIDSLTGSQITAKGGIDACKELIKLRIRRELCANADQVKEFIINNGELKIDELIAGADKIYNQQIDNYITNDHPEDLFQGIDDVIQERVNNPEKFTGLIVPYKYFYKAYGPLRNGNLYSFLSRPGVGKSTILNDLAYKVPLINNCKSLILDTENLTADIKFRMAAAISGVPCTLLERGLFVRNRELLEKYNASKDQLKKLQKLTYHKQVAGRPIEEIVAMIRRWYYNVVGRGNPAIVIYDYIKLTGEKDYQKKEYELVGEKVNRLKELSVELDIPILTANQLNRTAESGVDDSSAISQSDRLQWYSSFCAIFRRKTLEEIAEDGIEYGGHKMIVLKSRHQGEEASGHSDLVRVPTGKKTFKYVNNFISFNVDNFNVEEKGDLRDILNAKKQIIKIKTDNNDDDDNTSF